MSVKRGHTHFNLYCKKKNHAWRDFPRTYPISLLYPLFPIYWFLETRFLQSPAVQRIKHTKSTKYISTTVQYSKVLMEVRIKHTKTTKTIYTGVQYITVDSKKIEQMYI